MGEAARRKKAGGLSALEGGGAVNRLAVILDWPYSLVPVSYHMALMASDVATDPGRFFVRVASPHADIGGNRAIKYALEAGATELLLLSADQTVPVDVLARFRAHNKPIVAALTASRSQANHPWLLYEYTIDGRFIQVEPNGGLQRVGYAGPGCMLVKAEVFKQLTPPWFYTTASSDGCDVLVTNDFHFAEDCAKAGIEMYCDTSVVSDHLHEIALNAQSLGRSIPRIEVVGNGSAKELKDMGTPMPKIEGRDGRL